jgi:hypothetical protein
VTEGFGFSVVLEPQEDGGFTVLVPAFPEAVTEATPRRKRSPTGMRPPPGRFSPIGAIIALLFLPMPGRKFVA